MVWQASVEAVLPSQRAASFRQTLGSLLQRGFMILSAIVNSCLGAKRPHAIAVRCTSRGANLGAKVRCRWNCNAATIGSAGLDKSVWACKEMAGFTRGLAT